MSVEDDLNMMIKDAALIALNQQYELNCVRLEYVEVLLYEANIVCNAFPINKYENLYKTIQEELKRLNVCKACNHRFTPVTAVCSTIQCSKCDYIYEV